MSDARKATCGPESAFSLLAELKPASASASLALSPNLLLTHPRTEGIPGVSELTRLLRPEPVRRGK